MQVSQSLQLLYGILLMPQRQVLPMQHRGSDDFN